MTAWHALWRGGLAMSVGYNPRSEMMGISPVFQPRPEGSARRSNGKSA